MIAISMSRSVAEQFQLTHRRTFGEVPKKRGRNKGMRTLSRLAY